VLDVSFVSDQNAAEEYDRQMELQQQLAAERRLAQLQAEAEVTHIPFNTFRFFFLKLILPL
jgi:hypothetical protein